MDDRLTGEEPQGDSSTVDTYHVSHEYTDYRGMPGAFEETMVSAESEEQAIERAKYCFDHLEDEDAIEVRKL